MNHRQLAQVGLGLLGVWSLLTAVGAFMSIAAFAGASPGRLAFAMFIPIALLLGLSYLLIFHNREVAQAILPDVAGIAGSPWPDLARTLVALLGVLLLVQAAPAVITNILSLFTVGGSDPSLRGQIARRLIGSLVPMAAGAYLVARPERLLEFLERPAE